MVIKGKRQLGFRGLSRRWPVERKNMPNAWYLYWISSDTPEDCFVVARNSRSACGVEIRMNGFRSGEVRATRILQIPEEVERWYTSTRAYKKRPWPWYVYGRRFFKGVGARFRTIDGQEEMLIDDTVYVVEEFGPCGMYPVRTIGMTASRELSALAVKNSFTEAFNDDEVWSGGVIHLVTGLGMCLVRCQQIENYIADSFVLGAFSRKERENGTTIDQLRSSWKKKTLGGMMKSIEESWHVEPTIREGIILFIEMRNLLVHGLTTHDRYDIRTEWGQREIVGFLSLFDQVSKMVRIAFRASYLFSIQFALDNFERPVGFKKFRFNRKQTEEMASFTIFFDLKVEGEPSIFAPS